MNWFEGFETDMDFSRPKIYISETQIIIENVSSIISLSETQITVSSGGKLSGQDKARLVAKEQARSVAKGEPKEQVKAAPQKEPKRKQARTSKNTGKRIRYTTIFGEGFLIKEISDGRILVEGQIQKVEFLQP